MDALPPSKRKARVLVLAPAELIASKLAAYHERLGQTKSGTDWRDLAMLLLAFPELKRDPGPVTASLESGVAKDRAGEIRPSRPDDEF